MERKNMDEINYKKSELKLYNFFKKKIAELTLELERVATDLQGISSPSNFQEIKIENPPRNNSRMYELLEEEERLIQQRNQYEDRKTKVDDWLEAMDEEDREIITKIFIEGVPYDKLYGKYNMSKRSFFRKISRALS